MKPDIENIDLRNRLFIVRGIPGSGKTTLSRLIAIFIDNVTEGRAEHFATDMFWEKDGEYNFNPVRLDEAHKWCRRQVEAALSEGVHSAVVHNTFSQRWEVTPYLDIADTYGYNPFILETQNFFGSEHDIPERTFDEIAGRFHDAVEVNRPDME